MLTPKEYLRQAYRLDQRINANIEEVKNLREMPESVSGLRYREDPIQTTRSIDAPFIRVLEKAWEIEERIADELSILYDLKEQIKDAIATVKNIDERLVLQYRYMDGMTWEAIGETLHADRTTVWRWHGRALQHFKMPKCPIELE